MSSDMRLSCVKVELELQIYRITEMRKKSRSTLTLAKGQSVINDNNARLHMRIKDPFCFAIKK